MTCDMITTDKKGLECVTKVGSSLNFPVLNYQHVYILVCNIQKFHFHYTHRNLKKLQTFENFTILRVHLYISSNNKINNNVNKKE